MTFTWTPEAEPPKPPISVMGWVRLGLRGTALFLVITSGVVSMALIRPIEKLINGVRRPWTPWITQAVCRSAFAIFGMRHETQGERMAQAGAVVANHVSWLDIFALNARKRVYFVSKSEVAGWPGIGLLAKITGTVFIARDPRQAKSQKDIFEERLLAGHKLLFFPEGTSTDGMRVLPFKSTLFEAFFNEKIRHEMHIQPVTVIYTAPEGEDARFYGWWGDMNFGAHLVRMLAAKRHGAVKILYHQPVKVDDFANRKALSAHVENVVRRGMPPERQVSA